MQFFFVTSFHQGGNVGCFVVGKVGIGWVGRLLSNRVEELKGWLVGMVECGYASFSDADDSETSSILSNRSCLIADEKEEEEAKEGSSEEAFDDEAVSSCSIFRLLPLGAGSNGVRQ